MKATYNRISLTRSFPQLRPSGPPNNATPHAGAYSEAVKASCCSDGWNINVVNQPPRSSDFSVLDFKFFLSSQALQYPKRAYNVEQLVAAFTDLESMTLSKCFLPLPSVLKQAILVRGGNAYKIPHLDKYKWVRVGDLPLLLPYSDEAVETATAVLGDVVV
ncbi:hypothetical protein JG688_00016613 [Phytophthora aleatoria]|uniref:Uncharacterized protein n=1 Tax=Phytophthora aleatoria TaxID=2496075 RepID=A0A8J5IC16_9STRA|nr:hypothetical protein JG688_00016613 [Phytophthora aleatoria]